MLETLICAYIEVIELRLYVHIYYKMTGKYDTTLNEQLAK